MDFCVCASLFLVTDNAITLFRLIRAGTQISAAL